MCSSIAHDSTIDFDHLAQMTLGDARLESEILALFSTQAADLTHALTALPPDAAALAHKLKGSARAVGAFGVATAVENFERVLGEGCELSDSVNAVEHAVAQARAAIDEMLRQPRIGSKAREENGDF